MIARDEKNVIDKFVNINNEMKPLREHLEYLNDLCKQAHDFDSLDALQTKINEFEVKKFFFKCHNLHFIYH